MPGTVIAVKVAVGGRVAAGDALGVLEAMKMEHTLTAPRDGVVTRIGAAVGEQVPIGAQLFAIAADPSAGSEGPS